MFDLYVRRDIIHLTEFCEFEDSIPVLFGGSLHWLYAEFPRTIYTGVLFETVVVSPVVHLNRLEMNRLVDFLVYSPSFRLLEILKELEMDRPLFPLFHLPAGVHCFELFVQPFNVLLRLSFEVVNC